MIKSTLLAALLVSAFAAGAHAQPMMAPKVINYLATLHDVNKSYYGGAVLGVARFSGSGRVEATKDQWGHPDITIDTGSGVVNCSPSSPVDGIKPGDVVTLSGSVGGATTGASIETLDRALGLVPRKQRDTLLLVTGTCPVSKQRSPLSPSYSAPGSWLRADSTHSPMKPVWTGSTWCRQHAGNGCAEQFGSAAAPTRYVRDRH